MKLRFDPYQFSEVPVGEYLIGFGGGLKLRCSAPSPLYIRCGGYEALVGVDTDFDVSCGDGFEFCLAGAKGVRAFVQSSVGLAVEKDGETFTNPDRQTNESGAVLEVRRALREQQLRHREFLREVRAERAAFRAQNAPPANPPVPEGESEGENAAD